VSDDAGERMKEYRRQLRDAVRLHVPLASGRDAFGRVWELRVWGAPDELYTHFRVAAEDETWRGGSTVGPALERGRRLALRDWAERDSAPSRIIVHVAAGVDAAAVWLSDGRRYVLGLYGDPAQFGARIGALAFPSQLELRRVDLLQADGKLLSETR
jgi:hypothetical protein